jgi:hypothetical protein
VSASRRGPTPLSEALAAARERSGGDVDDVLLVDEEGVLVAADLRARSVDREEVAVEVTAAVAGLGRAESAAAIGRASEWIIVGDEGCLVVRRVAGTGLTLVLRGRHEAWVGRVRFASRFAVDLVEAAVGEGDG